MTWLVSTGALTQPQMVQKGNIVNDQYVITPKLLNATDKKPIL